jgi:uncharacterized membrane protein
MMDTNKQKQTITTLYAFLIASTILGCMPNVMCGILSLVLLLSVLISAYWYKFRDHQDGLLYNHMTYLIGTIWIGSTFLAIGIGAASYLVYQKGDHSLIQGVFDQISNGIMLSESDLMRVFFDYMSANQALMLNTALITIGPAILYLVYRIANGMARGAKGYRIANPKSWF